MLKKAQKIGEKLAAARKHYQAVAHKESSAKVAAAADAVRELQDQLQAAIADGAKACPTCKTKPIGLLKTPEVQNADGTLKSGSVYEVGCPACDVRRARGSSPEQAVEEWNAGNHNTRRVVEQVAANA